MKRPPVDNFPLPVYLDPEAWEGFVAMRKAKGKGTPFTQRAAVLTLLTLQKLKDAGQDPNACLDQSTQRGWSGVFPVKDVEVQVRNKALESELAEAKRREREAFEATQTPEGRTRVANLVQMVKGAINRRQA